MEGVRNCLPKAVPNLLAVIRHTSLRSPEYGTLSQGIVDLFSSFRPQTLPEGAFNVINKGKQKGFIAASASCRSLHIIQSPLQFLFFGGDKFYVKFKV